MEVIRLLLDGRWNARDMSLALLEVENYFSFKLTGDVNTPNSFPEMDIEPTANGFTIHGMIYPKSNVEIVQIRYGSPGFCDLAGLGKIVEELRIFIQFIIDHKTNRHLRDLELEERRVALQERKLQAILVAKQNGLVTDADFIEKQGADNLLRLIDDRQIVGVEKISRSE